MNIKALFQGKKAKVVWINVALMVAAFILIPLITLFYIDSYTNHGERVEVPSVEGLCVEDAEGFLAESGLVAQVTDSISKKGAKPGTIYSQTPKAGSEVKSGRMVYLTIVRASDMLVEIPDLVGNSSVEEARQILANLGFSFTEDKEVESEEKDALLGIYQGSRKLYSGQKVSTDLPVTLYVGMGFVADTLGVEEYLEEEDYD